MRRPVLLLFLLAAVFSIVAVCSPPPKAHADNLACPYPFTGPNVEVNVAIQIEGGWCDGPTEINGTHWHCPHAKVLAAGGGIGLDPFEGFNIGGILSGGVGGGGSDCSWRCPDNTRGPQPNPPGAWKDYLVVRPGNNSCLGHMVATGITSEPVEPDQGPPGYQPPNVLPPRLPDSFQAPEELLPTITNPGQGNPDALG